MKVVVPVTIGETQLISSNVPETEYAAYSSTTDYAVGARVIYLHKIWESVQTPNLNKTPDLNPLFWALISATNRYAMFDSEVSTQTVIASPLTVTVAPGLANSLALLELVGTSVSVSIKDGATGPEIYSYSGSLEGSILLDWYDYFYEPFKQKRQLVLTNLPSYGSQRITVTLSGGASVKCGYLIAGNASDIGEVLHGAGAGITDFSRKDTSATGVTTFVKRKFSKRMNVRMVLSNAEIDKIQRVLAEIRATPAVWLGTPMDGYELLTIFGFYRDFSLDVAYPASSLCSLEIEGLT